MHMPGAMGSQASESCMAHLHSECPKDQGRVAAAGWWPVPVDFCQASTVG